MIQTWFNQDIKKPVKVQYLDGNVFSQDNKGNLIGVNVLDDGLPASVSGSVSANVIRADGGTVAVSGTLAGNRAYVELPQSAYYVPGVISIIIKLTNDTEITTLCAVVANVYQSTTDTVIDPGSIIPSIQTLIAEIQAAIAEIPADYSMLMKLAQGSVDAEQNLIFPSLAKNQIIKNYISGNILTGTTTTGKAWRKNGTETSGSAYCYTKYTGLTSYVRSILIISGYNWAANWPLVCFYDSSDNLLLTYGNQNGGTAHVHNFIPVPDNTSYCIVNGKTSTNEPEVATISATALNQLLSGSVMSFGTTISSSFISSNPDYAYVRNYPTNAVYNIETGVTDLILDLPNAQSGANSLGSLVKFSGSKGQDATGYTVYIYANLYNECFIGWDTGVSIRWFRLNENSTDVQLGMEYIEPSTTTTGKARKTDGTETTGGVYLYSEYDISSYQEKNVFVSGYHYASDYPAYMTCDSNGDLISSASFSNATPVYQTLLKVPSNASKLYVNGRMSNTTGGVYPSVQVYNTSFTLNDLYNTHKKRRYLFIGDSYCEGYSHDGSNSGWATYCAGYMGLTSDDYVRKYRGGASFSANGSNNTYQALLVSADYPFDYFTDIVVCGGYNDNSHTESDIKTGISSFVTLAKGKYPNANVHIGFVAWNKQGNGSGAIEGWQAINAALTGTVLPAYQKCVEYGVDYLNNVEYWLNNDGLTPSDGYHPSEVGNQSIARAVANALLTGSAQLPYNADLRL